MEEESKLTARQGKINHQVAKTELSLVLILMVMGGLIRLTNLEAKPPWADEWATLVFSLGNSFLTIPLDQIINFTSLMQPLQIPETISLGGVVSNLLNESTHPPVYFALTHIWLKLFSSETVASVALARSLSVLFSVVNIPAIFYLAKLITDSRLCAWFAAILMAFSP